MRSVTKDQLTKLVAAAMLARNQADKQIDKNTKRVGNWKFPGTELSNFQKLDGTLTADSFYGPNVAAALKWYLQKSSDPHVPNFAPKYDGIKVTWTPPTEVVQPVTKPAATTTKPVTSTAVSKTPVAAPKPATSTTKPVASTPASAPAPSKLRTVTKDQLVKIVAAAMIARNQADKLVTSSTKRVTTAKFPGTSLTTFQQLDGSLTADDYYGPNVVAALKWYLQKSSDPHVPLADAKYDHIQVTWAPPSLYEPAKPATAAAIPTPKPAAKPVVSSKPSPAPAPAPAPKPSSSFSNLVFPSVISPQLQQAIAAVKPTKKPAKKPKKVTVPPTPEHGQELHTIKPAHDAEDHIAAMVSGKPKPKPKSHDAEDLLAEKVAAKSSSAIQKINQKMIKAALQQQATSEHKGINKELAFKRAVLQQLNSIQKKIAARGGPSNAIERRIVGLVI